MRVAQIVLPDASEYERKSQRIDLAALSGRHHVTQTTADRVDADVAHVYGKNLPPSLFRGFPVPYVASAPVRQRRFSVRKAVQPSMIVSPLSNLPEAVEESYFDAHAGPASARSDGLRRIGSFGSHRRGVTSLIERTLVRIHRFREDVTWDLYDTPTAADLTSVDLWVDPATDEEDFDGLVAEALVTGTPVVATRTAINLHRLEKGHIGFLVPANDPNEMTHAILTALFKVEVAEQKGNAARHTVSKFRPRRRLRILLELYGTLTA
jgi:glycosyltransferase involved in cell wall biosynthesis